MKRQSVEERARARIPHVEEYYDRLKYEVDPLGGFRLCRSQRLPHITINEYGFRGSPFNGSETILLLGDSVTFGVGASGDHGCFSRFLEVALRQPVADASVRAYRVCQQFGQLPRLLEMLPQVRLAVLWCGYADLLFWAITGGCVEGAFQFERKYRDPSRRGSLSLLPRPLLMLVRTVGRRQAQVSTGIESRARETGSLQDLLRHILLYIGAIRDLCSARRIRFEVLIQPFIRSRPTDAELRAITDFYDERIKAKCGLSWYEAAPLFTGHLMSLLNQVEGLHAVDCQPLTSEADFLDQVHMREKALERLAVQLIPLGDHIAAFHRWKPEEIGLAQTPTPTRCLE